PLLADRKRVTASSRLNCVHQQAAMCVNYLPEAALRASLAGRAFSNLSTIRVAVTMTQQACSFSAITSRPRCCRRAARRRKVVYHIGHLIGRKSQNGDGHGRGTTKKINPLVCSLHIQTSRSTLAL